MNNKLKIKQRLFRACAEDVEKRINSIQKVLNSIEDSRNNETKSSAGDKYETGRAMMQIEEEKSKNQLFQIIKTKQELNKIDPGRKTVKVESGSLVETNKGNYFISIGIGKIQLDDELYYCLSKGSPMGVKLMGKEKGDEIDFNGSRIRIENVS